MIEYRVKQVVWGANTFYLVALTNIPPAEKFPQRKIGYVSKEIDDVDGREHTLVFVEKKREIYNNYIIQEEGNQLKFALTRNPTNLPFVLDEKGYRMFQKIVNKLNTYISSLPDVVPPEPPPPEEV